MFDTTTGSFQVCYTEDSSDRSQLKTMLAQIQPKEVIYNPSGKNATPSAVVKMLKSMPLKPSLTLKSYDVPNPAYFTREKKKKSEAVDADALDAEAEDAGESGGGEQSNQLFDFPTDVDDLLNDKRSAHMAVAYSLKYLKEILLHDHVAPLINWSVYEPFSMQRHMMLDNTALENLDIMLCDGKYKNSLMEFLNKTKTPFGYRLLKTWLCSPLYR